MSADQFELLRIMTHVLRVHVNCQGCKHKVRKILRKIEGVYAIDIDEEQEKVTVTGAVAADTLIEKLLHRGKHAELWFLNGSNHRQVHVKDMNNSHFGYDSELISYKMFMEENDRPREGGYFDMESLPGEIEYRSIMADEERDHGRNRGFGENEFGMEHMMGYNGMLGIPDTSPPWNRLGNLSRRLAPPQHATGGLGFADQLPINMLMSNMDMHNGYLSNHPSTMMRTMPEMHNIRRNMIMGENLYMPYPQNMNQNAYFQERPYSYPATISAAYTYY